MPVSRSTTGKAARVRSKSDGATCTICGFHSSRKHDLPRHMATHNGGVNDRSICCPWEGCTFTCNQRSNLNTHYRRHTKEQLSCPEENCFFSAVDPSSILRHRKASHGYVPRSVARAGASDGRLAKRTRPRSLPGAVERSLTESKAPSETSTQFSLFKLEAEELASSSGSERFSTPSTPAASDYSCPYTSCEGSPSNTYSADIASMFAAVQTPSYEPYLYDLPLVEPYHNWAWANGLSPDFVSTFINMDLNQTVDTKDRFWLKDSTTSDFSLDDLTAPELAAYWERASTFLFSDSYNAFVNNQTSFAEPHDFQYPEQSQIAIDADANIFHQPVAFEPCQNIQTNPNIQHVTSEKAPIVDYNLFFGDPSSNDQSNSLEYIPGLGLDSISPPNFNQGLDQLFIEFSLPEFTL